MKTIPILVLLAVASASCTTPLAPSQSSDGVAIMSLAPASGPIGTRVTVNGSGLTSTANTVTFTAVAVDGDTPNEASVIPDLPSPNGTTISFDVLAVWRPACSYAAQGPCPFARIATAPGTYRVVVTNTGGTSNAMLFSVTR